MRIKTFHQWCEIKKQLLSQSSHIQTVKFQDSLCSPPPSGHKHSLLSQPWEQVTSETEPRRAAAAAAECRQGFIFTATVAILSLALSYFLYQMLSVYCAALMKRARTFLVCLKEGRDGLISMASDGDSGLWFSSLEHVQHFSTFFSACGQNGTPLQVLMNISTKSLAVTLFFFTFVFPFVLITVLLSPLESFHLCAKQMANVCHFEGLAICEIH